MNKVIIVVILILLTVSTGLEIAAQSIAAPFSWTSTGILVSPKSDSSHNIVSVKDPTIVYYNGLWHLYATVFNTTINTYNMVYLSFSDWSQAANATHYYMDSNPNLGGYKCAPQVFYFAPQAKWYLIYQTQPPTYSTATTIGGPANWSAPQAFYSSTPTGIGSLWIDFWVICDSLNAYLFFSGDDGKLYRSQTTLSNFPNGFGAVTTVMTMSTYELFEAACVYKINGQEKYLLLVEAIGSAGRYYKAFTATTLNGSWSNLAASESNPFCGKVNVTFEAGITAWTSDFSHGELLRAGYDQTMAINDGPLQFLYQGTSNPSVTYNLIPWHLGILKQNTIITRTATASATATRTATSSRTAISRTATVTRTMTMTPTTTSRVTATSTTASGTCTCAAGCSALISIAPNFSKDGAGQFCYSAASLGNYINSWNLATLNINGVDLTNKWVASASFPVKINNLYYIYYNSTVAYGHFEAMN